MSNQRQIREDDLLDRLRINGEMRLEEAVSLYRISPSTARRLFERLERNGAAIRTHGGIRQTSEYSFKQLLESRPSEKAAIAAVACDLLTDGDTVFCDAGTTVLRFCIELSRRIGKTLFDITVCTNSLANLEVLSDQLPVTLIGGVYRPNRKDFAGYAAETVMEKFHFSKCFLGADGCDMKKYFTTTDHDTARLDEIAIGNSDRPVILCDSGKFDCRSNIGFAAFNSIDTVVTDSELSPETAERLKAAGLVPMLADNKNADPKIGAF